MSNQVLTLSPLGQSVSYKNNYSPDLLCAIPRSTQRQTIISKHAYSLQGVDIWNGYEISWLNSTGKPIVARAVFTFNSQSPNLIESKSFKLYLNSYNQTCFDSFETVQQLLAKDLSEAAQDNVEVKLIDPQNWAFNLPSPNGFYLDQLDISVSEYNYAPHLLKTSQSGEIVEEILYSHLLKSNCLVTHQPDWGSIIITYSGKQIDHEALLSYLISFRNHNEFHEHCVERITIDLLDHCQPNQLLVEANYTRRGGLDINPIRAYKYPLPTIHHRVARQ